MDLWTIIHIMFEMLGYITMPLFSNAPVFGFMYQCQETEPLSEVEIAKIVEVSRRNNELRGITGMLLYRDGRFLQVLEGEKDAVLGLINTIRKDPRQKALTVLYESEWPRLFGEWTMDYRRLELKRGLTVAPEKLSASLDNFKDVLERAPLRVRKRLVTFAAGA